MLESFASTPPQHLGKSHLPTIAMTRSTRTGAPTRAHKRAHPFTCPVAVHQTMPIGFRPPEPQRRGAGNVVALSHQIGLGTLSCRAGNKWFRNLVMVLLGKYWDGCWRCWRDQAMPSCHAVLQHIQATDIYKRTALSIPKT